ncbi:MAG TPA: hypothetical protein VIH59_27750 [Candidatus Tectomicrobia bacterium]
MRKTLLLPLTCILFLNVPAHANLCDSVKDRTTTAATKNDVNFYEELFPDPTDRGNRLWNEIVLQCNRQRDTKGNEVSKVTAAAGHNTNKQLLKARDLETKVIRGHYNFFGTVVTQLKYVYVLSKKDGVWTMIIPYRPIINELVTNRIDFNFEHTRKLYDASQVVNPASSAQVLTLKPSPESIVTTLCSTSTYFPGDEGKYDNMELHKRDPENKFISLGKIQYRYEKDGNTFSGCRVNANRDLYWRWDPNGHQVVRVKPQDWILDNFVRTAESYWTIPGIFQLKLLMQGRNESAFPKSTLDLLQDDDHLTVRFATKFLPYGFNQMYKSNIIQFNNFSTMTTDGTYWHEVGHAFGLDDEYGGETKDDVDKRNGCDHVSYQSFSPGTYQMCDAGADEKRTIYHYLAVSRYITAQSECNSDGDCGTGRYCDQGTLTVGKNQCVELKADNQTCDLIGGGHQCQGGQCKFGRCYTPNSVAMGDTCYVDDACKAGKCSSVDGAKGTCVCKTDSDCDANQWCDAGADTQINVCRTKLARGASCGKAGSVGNDHKCKSGECSGFPKYVCK